jgi:amicyanin
MPATRTDRPLPPMTLRAIAALATMTAIAIGGLMAAGGARAGTSHTVDIANFAFSPATLTIQVGDTVTWTNLDAVQHTATSTTGVFDSGLLDQDAGYSFTFTQPGTYDYLCTPHPTMTGQIVVQAAPAATPAASQGTSGGGSIPDVAMAAEPNDLRVPIGVGLLVLAVVSAVGLRRMRATR